MPLAELDNLVRIGKLKAEPSAPSELAGLVRSGTVRLADAARTELSAESRFDLAYNAAHSFSLAALRWHGYRSENRYLVFQSLTHTLGLPPAQWRVLDDAHRKRNLAEYEGEIEVGDALLDALLRVANELAVRVRTLIATSPERLSVGYFLLHRMESARRSGYPCRHKFPLTSRLTEHP